MFQFKYFDKNDTEYVSRVDQPENVDYVINFKPPFLLKWANFFFLVIIGTFILTCWSISYPEIIVTRAKLSLHFQNTQEDKISSNGVKMSPKESDDMGKMRSLEDLKGPVHRKLEPFYISFLQNYVGLEHQVREESRYLTDTSCEQYKKQSLLNDTVTHIKDQMDKWGEKLSSISPAYERIPFRQLISLSGIKKQNHLALDNFFCGTTYFMEAILPESDIKHIKLGQSVILKFDDYPFEKYGTVAGSIVLVEKMLLGEGYRIKIILTKVLNTNPDLELELSSGAMAAAEITIGRKRFIQTVYANLIKSFNH